MRNIVFLKRDIIKAMKHKDRYYLGGLFSPLSDINDNKEYFKSLLRRPHNVSSALESSRNKHKTQALAGVQFKC